MNTLETDSPWYCLVNNDELMQGDILENCPIFFPPPDLTLNSLAEGEADFAWEERDVIIMSQSCDLAIGKKNVQKYYFALCGIVRNLRKDICLAPRVWKMLEEDNFLLIMFLTNVN